MNKWLRKIEDMMASSAYAEEGEFETAKNNVKQQRAILLALTGPSLDTNALRYAINTCKRTGAVLEIVYNPAAADSLALLKSDLEKEKIEYFCIRKTGRMEDEIPSYTEKRTDILFVVIEAPAEAVPGSKKAGRKFQQSWNKLKCPLVTVSGPSAA
ncbi:MAG: hypothetical protein AB1499_18095 [Nitrospirota bacterium]